MLAQRITSRPCSQLATHSATKPRRIVRRARNVSVRAESDSSSPTASPFATASVHREIGEKTSTAFTEMTKETVDKALDQVRPYLMADGGDVEVVGIENGTISVRLEGTCSSCAASDATLKMGIERALRTTFGDQLKEVVQVKEEACDMPKATTMEMVNMHLGMLRGAVAAYGGSLDVLKVEPPVVEMKYEGPEGIGKGLQAAIIAQFKDIREVKFV